MRKRIMGPGGWKKGIWVAAASSLLLGACTTDLEEWRGPADPIVEPVGVLGEILAAPLTITAAGETSLIEVAVIGLDGQAAAGIDVSFSAELGTITPTAASDAQGVARAVFTAGTASGLARIVASIPGADRSLTVLVGEGTLTVEPETILADGNSVCQVSGYVPVEIEGGAAGRSVTFATTAGILAPAEARADSTGWVNTWLSSVASDIDVGAAVTMNDKENPGLVLGGTMVVMRGVSVELTADESILMADGVSETVLRAVLRETSGGIAVGDVPVLFSVSHGTVTASDTTDASGVATAVYTSPGTSGEAVVRATFAGSVSDSAVLTISNVALTLSAPDDTLEADGNSSVVLTAWLGNPVTLTAQSGEQIRFSSTLGEIDTLAVTDGSGEARAVLRAGTWTGTSRVEAVYRGSVAAQYELQMVPPTVAGLWLSLTPGKVVADGVSTAEARAVVSLGGGAPTPDGTVVAFSSGGGVITPSAQTESGVASATLMSSAEIGSHMPVVASVGDMSDTAWVDFVAGPASELGLTVDPDTLAADGLSTATVTARVADAAGNAVEDGTVVQFSTDLGWVTSSQLTESGEAVGSFTAATDAGAATITAMVASAEGDTVRSYAGIHLVSGEPGDIVLSTDRLSIGVAGVGEVETSDIVAWVKDKNGNPVADGTQVTFEIIFGPGGGEHLDAPGIGYGPIVVPTAGGMARTTLRSGTLSGVVNVEARVGTVTNSGAQVLIESGPPDRVMLGVSGTMVSLDVGSCLWHRLVTASVVDQYSNPVEDSTAVHFSLSAGALAMIEGTSSTGAVPPYSCSYIELWPGLRPVKGAAFTCLTYTSSACFDTYQITASTAGGSVVVEESMLVSNPIVEPTVNVSVAPAVADSSLGGVCTVTASLQDLGGFWVEGGVIDFSADHGGVSFTSTWAVTGPGGWASTQLIVPPALGRQTIIITARLSGSGYSNNCTVEVK